jgi:hypothetical protein
VSHGRDYVTRSELVETIRERFRKIDAIEGADGTEQSDERQAQAGPRQGKGVGEGGSLVRHCPSCNGGTHLLGGCPKSPW